MNYTQAMQYLKSREQFGIKLGLEGITELLAKLGNPQDKLKVIHVAGSNGKGSTCAMIASVLKEAGYHVGLYISPHLIRFTERISINGMEISKEDVSKYLSRIKPLVKEQTYFEIVTALAFLYFAEHQPDYVILEVGMGGRLDATNVVKKPLLCIITSLTLEHTQYLGKTIEKITAEKAGIIKDGSFVITPQNNEGLDVIKTACQDKNATLILSRPSGMQPSLLGNFQKINAGIAIKAAKTLNKHHGTDLTKQIIISGLEHVVWPGRVQYLAPDLLVDCAHTAAGAHELACYLHTLNKNCIFVISILEDKDYKTMIDEWTPFASQIIFTKAPTPRALKPEALIRVCNNATIIADPKRAVAHARSIKKPADLIVVTGSCYLVGEVLEQYG